MGEHDVDAVRDERQIRAFTRAVLQDIRALEAMIERGMIERRVRRVGAEQEMLLIDADCRPAPIAVEVLAHLSDSRFATELARFNLEVDFAPQPFGGRFLKRLEDEINETLARAREAAARFGARILLTGTLPTLHHEDLGLDNLTPELRFQHINDAISEARGGAITVVIDGIDQYEGTHDSVILEGANTSLQLHLQVDPDNAARLYNLAQLITAPLLAAATNSPVLLGRRLWHETRVALFERAVDERSGSQLARGVPSRVTFGDAWVHESILEIFRDNAARYHVIMTRQVDLDPLEQIEQGLVPDLAALALHNGTVWRWNRPCYGITEGKAHLRIESRILPAGPTVVDEVANAALFYGMMIGLEKKYGDVSSRMPFEDAKTNFLAAAKHGLNAQFIWVDGRNVPARQLLLEELIPNAREGLHAASVPSTDLDKYLGIVEERIRSGQTGSRWLLDTLARNRNREPHEVCRSAVTVMLRHQHNGQPVHRWHLATMKAASESFSTGPAVGKIMTRDVFTVRPDDVIDLATSVMDWKHVRHVPVENEAGKLVGLLSAREFLRLGEGITSGTSTEPIAVETIMNRNPVTVSPDTTLIDAMRVLLSTESGCLLIVSRGQLLGIVTERDFVRAAAALIERRH